MHTLVLMKKVCDENRKKQRKFKTTGTSLEENKCETP